MPDVFKKGVLAAAPRLQFLPRKNRIVDFASELPFEFLHYFRQSVAFRLADHENINVASRVLLVSRERAIQIGLFYSVDLLERFCEQGNRSDGLSDDIRIF